MSDDIVTRLRKPLPYNLVGLTTKDLGDERYEAADEIERLRKLTSELAQIMMPLLLLMTSEEQQKVIKVVRGE